jgi:hypothetical protein
MKRVVFMTSLTVLLAASSPVFAAEFWVSQDPTTKQCTIVEQMPEGKTQVMVGATSYSTRDAAKAAKKAARDAGVCV